LTTGAEDQALWPAQRLQTVLESAVRNWRARDPVAQRFPPSAAGHRLSACGV